MPTALLLREKERDKERGRDAVTDKLLSEKALTCIEAMGYQIVPGKISDLIRNALNQAWTESWQTPGNTWSKRENLLNGRASDYRACIKR